MSVIRPTYSGHCKVGTDWHVRCFGPTPVDTEGQRDFMKTTYTAALAAGVLIIGCGTEGNLATDAPLPIENPAQQQQTPEAVKASDWQYGQAQQLDQLVVPSADRLDEVTERTGHNPIAEEIAEKDEYEAAIPEGESAIAGDEETSDADDEDPYDQSKSEDFENPELGAVDTDSDIAEIPDLGWTGASEQAPWVTSFPAAFPHTLPERPVALPASELRPWTAGSGVAVHGNQLFVVSTEADSLVVLDRGTAKVQRIINVGKRPEQVVVAPDGTAYVTVRHGASVAKINPNASQVAQVVHVGAEPYSLALSVDTKALYVTISGENRVVALKTKSLSPLSNVPVDDRPRGVLVNSQGQVFVSLQHGAVLRYETMPGVGALLESTTMALRTKNPADLALHNDIKIDKTVPTRAISLALNPATDEVYSSHVIASPGSTEQSVTEFLEIEQETETTCETTCSKSCKQDCKQNCKQNCSQVCQNAGGYGGTVCSNSCSTNCSTSCSNVCNNICNTTCVTEILTFPHIIRPIEVSISVFNGDDDVVGPSESAAPVQDQTTGEPMTAICDKPMGAAHHPGASLLFVACKGTDNVMVFGTAAGDPMRSTLAEIKVGQAPTSLAIAPDGKRLYVRNSQSFTVSEVNIESLLAMPSVSFSKNAAGSEFPKFPQFPSGATLTHPTTLHHSAEVAFGVDAFEGDMALGRRIFTFARFTGLSVNGFFACATCHFEGTEDGLIWFIKDGPRQTPFLAQKLKGSAPFNWIGTADTMQKNITQTVKRMGGSGLSDAQKDALTEFLMSEDGLVLPPNPNLGPDGLTESQKAGKELFYHPSLGCADCHSGKALTDGENWDVGTFTPLEIELHEKNGGSEGLSLNTPSLKGLYNSAPYLHDGSAATLYDVLDATSATMGVTMQLTGEQRTDLVNYLLTL